MNQPAHRSLLLTPPGMGAIAAIRVVGPDPWSLVGKHFRHPAALRPMEEGLVRHGKLFDQGEVIDDVLVSLERYDDQLAIDITCHGGMRVVERIVELFERVGAVRQQGPVKVSDCWPSDNLIEAEAIEVMARARTILAADWAGLLRRGLPKALRQLATISDHDEIQASIAQLVQWSPVAQSLLAGVTVALIGPPNSGKSTLFNALLGRQAVVTSDVPGTTRDWVKESLEIRGLPIDLIDTAGRHDTACPLEQEAIKAGTGKAGDSDLFLFVVEPGGKLSGEILAHVRSLRPKAVWLVANKCDLEKAAEASTKPEIEPFFDRVVRISARTGEGLEMLKANLLEHFLVFHPDHPPTCFFTRRQVNLGEKFLSGSLLYADMVAALHGAPLADPACKDL